MSAKKFLDLEKIKTLYYTGLNSVQIAKELNTSPVSIRYCYKKLGLKAQTRSEAARKYNVNHFYFSNINDQDKAYILGLLYADGCNYISKTEVKVTLALTDPDIIYKINTIIQPDKPVYIETRHHVFQNKVKVNTLPVYKLCLQSRQISNDLILLGVTPNKSLNLKFPNISDDLISHFIRGFFDGDGGISVKSNNIRINFVGNSEFLIALQNILVKKLNINKTKILTNSKSKANNFSFSSKEDVIKFRDWLYKNANLFINRKYNKFYGKL